jgi:hypothetical protein
VNATKTWPTVRECGRCNERIVIDDVLVPSTRGGGTWEHERCCVEVVFDEP